MKKEKGFTLIELLAVILILAVILAIAVPKILDMIENSRRKSFDASVKLFESAIRLQLTSNDLLSRENFTKDDNGNYIFDFTDENDNYTKLDVKNKERFTGEIKYSDKKFIYTNFSDGRYVLNTDDSGNEIVNSSSTNSPIVCKRATSLHTETCDVDDDYYYCGKASYSKNDTITYGSLGTNGVLSTGDAFDCDVTGTGQWERFYYVSDYYNTNENKFDNDTAVLIYYTNISRSENGKIRKYSLESYTKPYNSMAYNLVEDAGVGPDTIVKALPTINEWRNVRLKNTTRKILNEKNGSTITYSGVVSNLPSAYSYSNKAARLLTSQEVASACNITINDGSPINLPKSCEFLVENTAFGINDSSAIQSYFLETRSSESYISAWVVEGHNFRVYDTCTYYDWSYGLRPAIEVPKTRLQY